MEKTLKIILVALLSFVVLFGLSQPKSYAYDFNTSINGLEQKVKDDKTNPDAANNIAASVINWIFGISVAVAVIVLMITGLKFIVGSTQEKAEYKKSLIPLVVGVLILVFATTIVKVIFSLSTSAGG